MFLNKRLFCKKNKTTFTWTCLHSLMYSDYYIHVQIKMAYWLFCQTFTISTGDWCTLLTFPKPSTHTQSKGCVCLSPMHKYRKLVGTIQKNKMFLFFGWWGNTGAVEKNRWGEEKHERPVTSLKQQNWCETVGKQLNFMTKSTDNIEQWKKEDGRNPLRWKASLRQRVGGRGRFHSNRLLITELFITNRSSTRISSPRPHVVLYDTTRDGWTEYWAAYWSMITHQKTHS